MSPRPRALITGISGQAGSYLAELLLEEGYDVFGVVRRGPGARYPNLAAVQDDLTLLRGDLEEPLSMVDALHRARPDEVYNLAASSFVPVSWLEPVATARSTVAATSLLEAVRILDPSIRFYQASTSEVFSGAAESPQRETTPLRPRTPYGIAKVHAQLMVGAYREHHGLHASCGISYNHESPRRPVQFVTRKVTRAAAAIKLGLQDELVMGSLDAVRDWTSARDHAEAIWRIVRHESGDDYVIASGTGHTVRELVDAAFGHVGLEADRHLRIDPQFVRPPEAHPLVGDPSKLRAATGWHARTGFEDLVAEMVEHDLRELREGPIRP